MEKTPPRVVCYKNFISSRGVLTGGAKKKKKKKLVTSCYIRVFIPSKKKREKLGDFLGKIKIQIESVDIGKGNKLKRN